MLSSIMNRSTEQLSQSFPQDSFVDMSQEKKDEPKNLVIIGSGDLAKALLKSFVKVGYSVTICSRYVNKNRVDIESLGGRIKNVKEGLKDAMVVICAVPFEAFPYLPADLLKDKIVIDVSNKSLNYKGRKESLAVQLQEMLPKSYIVKAFNTLSAYEIHQDLVQGNKEIPICSISCTAMNQVMAMIRDLGYFPVDFGNLSNSKNLEKLPLQFFPQWRFPAILGFSSFLLGFLILLFRDELCPNFNSHKPWDWSKFKGLLLEDVHNALACAAITLLSSCYFPGAIASYIQLYRGTKHSAFPSWLDCWMKSRKQLGLSAFFLAVTHAIMAVLQLCNESYDSDWQHFTYLALGCFALALMSVLAVTSLPSVTKSLSWREFSFLQRYFGWWCLFLALGHLIFKKFDILLTNTLMCYCIPDPGQIFIIFPFITVVLKLPLLLPCINSHLVKIRRGYQRKSSLTSNEVV